MEPHLRVPFYILFTGFYIFSLLFAFLSGVMISFL